MYAFRDKYIVALKMYIAFEIKRIAGDTYLQQAGQPGVIGVKGKRALVRKEKLETFFLSLSLLFLRESTVDPKRKVLPIILSRVRGTRETYYSDSDRTHEIACNRRYITIHHF